MLNHHKLKPECRPYFLSLYFKYFFLIFCLSSRNFLFLKKSAVCQKKLLFYQRVFMFSPEDFLFNRQNFLVASEIFCSSKSLLDASKNLLFIKKSSACPPLLCNQQKFSVSAKILCATKNPLFAPKSSASTNKILWRKRKQSVYFFSYKQAHCVFKNSNFVSIPKRLSECPIKRYESFDIEL